MTIVDDIRMTALNESLDILNMYQQGIISVLDSAIPCVVFDIDDTLICSRTRRPIQPMVSLYREILDRGIDIYIVTARQPVYLEITIEELHRHGIIGYRDIHMVGYHGNKAMRKAEIRETIENMGYDIILNIGDDPGDMMYGYYTYGIKLPYVD